MCSPHKLFCSFCFLLLSTASDRLIAAESVKPFSETQTLRIDSPGPYDDLGYSLGAGGDALIAGAINVEDALGRDVGAAFVYNRDSSGNWIQSAILQPNDGQHNDAFGWDVDIFGQTAIVGVPSQKPLGITTGAAYLFSNQSPVGWQQVAKLVAPDGARDERFGQDVALSESIAAVGAFSHQDAPTAGLRRSKGAVYTYLADSHGAWSFDQKLQPAGVKYGDSFGWALDVSGDTLVATAPSADPRGLWTGVAHIYRRDTLGWTSVATVRPDFSDRGGSFGTSVAMENGRLIIGTSPSQAYNARGTVYIYEENASGNWELVADLVPHDLDQQWYSGAHVSISGDFASVVAYAGPPGLVDLKAYVFQRGPSGQWNEVASLSSENALHSFGFSLASYDNQIFVGSGVNSPGAVHVFSQVPEPSALVLIGLAALSILVRRIGCRDS